MLTAVDSTSASFRLPRKSKLVWAGTMRSGFHSMLPPNSGSSVGRRQRTQVASSMRVKMVAVNRWVSRPSDSEVAKPRRA
jgi:hypothetical protein